MPPQPQHAASASAAAAPHPARAGLAAVLGRLGSISRGRLIAILVVLLVGILALYMLEPRIEPSVGAPADPNRAILTPFQITNGGFFAFRAVHLQCVARETEFEQTGASLPPGISNNVLHVTNVASALLRPGQKLAVTCAKGLENAPARLRYADFDLNLCLKPYPLIDYISLVHFRYVGGRDGSGNLHWSEREPRRSSIPWLVIQKESDKQECEWAE